MMKKIFIIFTLLVLIAASSTPALAQKPTDPNGKGNPSHENRGKGNSPDDKPGNQNNPNPAAQNPNTTNSDVSQTDTTSNSSVHGFDEYGYNLTARIFNGTAWDWCMAEYNDEQYCTDYLGIYATDHLKINWNAEWDRGNAEGWANPPYDAWESILWIGNGGGRSGEMSRYKIVWVGPCVEDAPFPNGGYCIWGQFEVIMDMGMDGGEHYWFAHAIPTGYGSYP